MKLKSNIIKCVTIASLPFFITGCVTKAVPTHIRLAELSAVSTVKIKNLEYEKAETSNLVKGENCKQIYGLVFPYIEDGMLERAITDAISNGNRRGINGDVLINTKISLASLYRNYDARYKCVFVEGNLVKVKRH